MDHRILFLFQVIISGIALSINLPAQGLLNGNQVIGYDLLKAKINYTDHNPIYIDGNTHFKAIVTAENWSGDGSESTPYIIDRLRIIGPRSNNLIEIRNTNVHFQINNCILSGGNGGVILSNVKNGIFSYNNINNNFYGIYLNHSINNIISWGKITHNGLEGIFLDISRNNTLFNNIITNNIWTGIELWDSESNNLSNNIIVHNSGSGVILGRSRSCIISSNNISFNSFTGINLFDLESCLLFENFIANNKFNGVSIGNVSNAYICNNNVFSNKWIGIRLYEAGSNTLTGNILYNNHKYGILLESSSKDNEFFRNDFIKNHEVDSSQAFDDGENNKFVYNYWDEWTSPDTNTDGIVDHSYHIDGNAGNQDPHPLVSQFLDINSTSDTIMFRSNTIAGLILLVIIICALIVLFHTNKGSEN
ncbi:MAG: right-handed parallel beta-helix repeat-containing protein [Candidatus Hodarchaeales archaeon]|jgi:parallel beta-helix repeat protein